MHGIAVTIRAALRKPVASRCPCGHMHRRQSAKQRCFRLLVRRGPTTRVCAACGPDITFSNSGPVRESIDRQTAIGTARLTAHISCADINPERAAEVAEAVFGHRVRATPACVVEIQRMVDEAPTSTVLSSVSPSSSTLPSRHLSLMAMTRLGALDRAHVRDAFLAPQILSAAMPNGGSIAFCVPFRTCSPPRTTLLTVSRRPGSQT